LVALHGLPESINPETKRDSRNRAFRNRFGELTQVELDALPPNELRDLYRSAIDRWWDWDAYDAVVEREERERARLRDLSRTWIDRDATILALRGQGYTLREIAAEVSCSLATVQRVCAR
jgi:DNA-directed RNA polymerase specialized sigma24 family protein